MRKKLYSIILIIIIFISLAIMPYIFATGDPSTGTFLNEVRSDFDTGDYTNTTIYDSTNKFLGLSSHDSEQEFPNNQEDQLANIGIGMNMTNNVLLIHLNKDSNYGENETHVYDFSGNGNNGVFTNNATSGIGSDVGTSGSNESGKLFGSYAFDGDGDEIRIPDSPSLSPSTELSISLWVYPRENAKNQILIAKDEVGSRAFSLLFRDNQMMRWIVCKTGDSCSTLDTTTTLPLNKWTHLTATYQYITDGSSIAKIYMDKKEEATSSTFVGSIADTSNDITVARRDFAPYENFINGNLDEIAIWDDTLSAQEVEDIYDRQKGNYIEKGYYISEIFNAGYSIWDNISWVGETIYGEMPSDQKDEISEYGYGTNMTGNILLWHLDEYSDEQFNVYDYSGNDNNGTASGIAITEGIINNSFEFFGTDDYVRNLNPEISNFNTSGSVSMWAYADFGIDSNRHVLFDTRTSDYNYGFTMGKPEPTWFASEGIFCGWRNIAGQVDWDDAVFDWDEEKEKWHHFAMTWDSATTTKTCYVDGIALITDTDATNFPTSTSTNIYIGTEATLVSDWIGKKDEVAFFNRTLSTAEVQNIYKRGNSKFNINVRSCNDPSCNGESWSDTYHTPLQDLSVDDNPYFQYRAEFEVYNVSLTPELYNVSISYTLLAECSPTPDQDWTIVDEQLCDTANVGLGSGKIIINEGGTLVVIGNSVVTADGLEINRQGDAVFVDQNSRLEIS